MNITLDIEKATVLRTIGTDQVFLHTKNLPAGTIPENANSNLQLKFEVAKDYRDNRKESPAL